MNFGFLKPLMEELYHNEPDWKVIIKKIGDKCKENNITIEGGVNLTFVKLLYNKAGFDLKKRPRANNKVKKFRASITFDESVEESKVESTKVETKEENTSTNIINW